MAEYGDPSVLGRVVDLSLPTPLPGSVLVKLAAAGVNPVETYMRSGTYARSPELPWTPGNDGAGVRGCRDFTRRGCAEVAGEARACGCRVLAVSGTYAE